MHELTTRGHPFDMGRQHGLRLRKQIGEALRKRLADLPLGKAGLVRQVLDRLDKAFPWLLEEMKGIAQGAGRDLAEVGAIALADELAVSPQCVAVGAVHGDVGPIFAKTIETDVAHEFTVHTVIPQAGESFVGIGKVSSVRVSAGVNASGLGAGLVTVGCKDAPGNGIPILILVRAVLQTCRSVEEACRLLAEHHGLMLGYGILLEDAADGVCVVEKSPTSQAVRYSDDGWLFTTVFLHPTMRRLASEPPAHQVRRSTRLEKSGEGLRGKLSFHQLREIIACRDGHGPINDPDRAIAASLLVSCRDRFMDVAAGRPDEAEFLRYRCPRR